MGEGHCAEERSSEWNRAEQQRAEQVSANEDGLTRKSINPDPSELAHQHPSDEIDGGESGRLGCIDPKADDGEEGECGPSDE